MSVHATPKHLLLVYAGHPGGTTDELRRAMTLAAQNVTTEVEVRDRWAPEATAEDLLWADGILLATPEHFGYMAGKLKDFFDRTFYPTEGMTMGKPYALVVSAGNDGLGTVAAVERIVKGYGWKAIAPAVRVVGPITEQAIMQATELAATLALGLAEGIY